MKFIVVATTIFSIAASYHLNVSPRETSTSGTGFRVREDLRRHQVLRKIQLTQVEIVCQSIISYASAIGTIRDLSHGDCGPLQKTAW